MILNKAECEHYNYYILNIIKNDNFAYIGNMEILKRPLPYIHHSILLQHTLNQPIVYMYQLRSMHH